MEYSAVSLIVLSVILPLLAVVAVCLRIWVRIKIAPSYLGADDWLAIAACDFALGDGANLIVGATLGFSGHDFHGLVPPDRYIVGNKLIIEKPLYAMTKLSALFFFRRIFMVKRQFKIMTEILIIFITIWAVTFIFLEAFSCGLDPSKFWTPYDLRTGCLDVDRINIAFAVTDSLLDILVVISPYPVLRQLQITARERLGLAALFLLGILGTVASLVRLAIIAQALPKNYDGAGNTHGASSGPDVWSMVEGSVGVMAVCLTPLAPLIRGRGVRRCGSGSNGSGNGSADRNTHNGLSQNKREKVTNEMNNNDDDDEIAVAGGSRMTNDIEAFHGVTRGSSDDFGQVVMTRGHGGHKASVTSTVGLLAPSP